MMKFLTIVFLIVGGKAFSQYPFEKFKSPSIKNYRFEMHEQDRHLIYSCEVNNFYNNQQSLKIIVNGDLEDYQKTYIKIDSIKYFEEIPAHGTNDLLVGDFNGDGLKDIKLSVFYMGSGLASMRIRILYFFQMANRKFTKVSYDDMQGDNRLERDINGDGNFEIITMNLNSYKQHNYWTFNAYNFVNNKLICVNEKVDYPIMVKFLYNENFKITADLTRKQMKKFSQSVPDELSISE